MLCNGTGNQDSKRTFLMPPPKRWPVWGGARPLPARFERYARPARSAHCAGPAHRGPAIALTSLTPRPPPCHARLSGSALTFHKPRPPPVLSSSLSRRWVTLSSSAPPLALGHCAGRRSRRPWGASAACAWWLVRRGRL